MEGSEIMNIKHALITGLASAAILSAAPAAAQGFPKMPKIPKVPKLPKVPKTSSTETVPTSAPSSDSTGIAMNGETEQDFMEDSLQLNQTVDANAEGEKIDAMVENIKAAAQRLATGNYPDVSSNRRQQFLQGRKQLADTLVSRTDRELDWAIERVSRNGGSNPQMPVLAYNQVLDLDTQLYVATVLFPDNAEYRAAKDKSGALLARFVSREQAAQAFDDMALAAAANVRMPPATTTDKSVENMFRTAWASSGIPYTIMKINIRGGWGVKREYGRVIGRTRTAAIAAKDPNADRCNLYDFTLLAPNGGGVRRLAHTTTRIACENVPK